MRNACSKTDKRFIVRGLLRIECEEKAKEEEYLIRGEVDEISL
jgi:hypothetical protein